MRNEIIYSWTCSPFEVRLTNNLNDRNKNEARESDDDRCIVRNPSIGW